MKYRNFLITLPYLFCTCLIGSLYTDISNIIDFIGGFCSTTMAFVLPVMIFIKGNSYERYHYKNIFAVLFFGILVLIGYISAIISLTKIVQSFI